MSWDVGSVWFGMDGDNEYRSENVGTGFFFFKQKTAYEMLRSLVGSEMCIRDSLWVGLVQGRVRVPPFYGKFFEINEIWQDAKAHGSLSPRSAPSVEGKSYL